MHSLQFPCFGMVWVVLLGACESRSPEEATLRLWVRSNLSVPRDLDEVRVVVSVDRIVHKTERVVLEGERGTLPVVVPLRRTAELADRPVKIVVAGYSKGAPFVQRKAVLSIPARDSDLYLKLDALCADGPTGALSTPSANAPLCGEEETCDGGKCVSAQIPESEVLATTGAGETYGLHRACFDARLCLDGLPSHRPILQDGQCKLAGRFPDAQRINVGLRSADDADGQRLSAGGGPGTLGLDRGEGPGDFRVEPTQVLLPDEVCRRSDSLRVVVSSRCPSKTSAMPVCGDARPSEVPLAPVDPNAPSPVDEGTGVPTLNPNTPGEPVSTPPVVPPVAMVALNGPIFGLGSEGLALSVNEREPVYQSAGAISLDMRSTPLAVGSPFLARIAHQPGGPSGSESCWIPQPSGTAMEGFAGPMVVQCAPRASSLGLRKLAMGGSHSCGLFEDGTVRCWGDLLAEAVAGGRMAVPLPGLTGVADLASGEGHVCGVMKRDGTVRCWGRNNYGQTAQSSVSKAIVGLAGVAALSAGGNHTCALLSAQGRVRCWGDISVAEGIAATATANIPDLSGAVALASGFQHACALLGDGAVRCWGRTEVNQTGGSSPSQSIAGLSGVVALAAGAYHTCARLDTGGIICWGLFGSKAQGPTPMVDFPPAEQLVSGMSHLCIRTAEGRVRCYGNDRFGQLAKSSPTQDAPGLSGVRALYAGSENTCAVVDHGGVRCWGLNASSQGGNNFSVLRTGGPLEFREVFPGEYQSCAITQGGTVRCWNDGSNSPTSESSLTRDLAGLSGVQQLALGNEHTCALLQTGRVRCWGSNRYQQLGSSSTTADIPGLTDAVGIWAGFFHTCALVRGGTVRCWGHDGDGQSGANSARVDVGGLANVRTMALGGYHSCALLEDGTVRCWGDDSAKQRAGSSAITSIAGLSGVRALAAGGYFTCVLLSTGTVRCWGDNRFAQVGNSSRNRDMPGLSGVVDLVAGTSHVCVLTQTQSVRCWGGAGWPWAQDWLPTMDLPWLGGVTAVRAQGHGIAVRAKDGTWVLFGSNDMGQVDGRSTLTTPLGP